MIFIIGLGNPGEKFQKSRHNLGFLVIDEFRKSYDFPKFRFSKKFLAEFSQGEIFSKKIVLIKPQTFVNLSGKAVKNLTKTYNLKPNNLIVIHDDIDLPLGKIRISKGRGSAGHKGVESIIRELKTKDFIRLRIGIRPQNSTFSAIAENVEKFVLQKFNKEEEKIVKEVIKKTVEAIEFSLKEGLLKAMVKYN